MNHSQNQNFNWNNYVKYKRVIAFIVDVVIAMMITSIVVVVTRYCILGTDSSIIIQVLYGALAVSMILKDVWGIGKACTGLVIVTPDGQKAKWYRRIVRNLLIGPLMMAEILLILADQTRIGDTFAKTKVVLK